MDEVFVVKVVVANHLLIIVVTTLVAFVKSLKPNLVIN